MLSLLTIILFFDAPTGYDNIGDPNDQKWQKKYPVIL